MACRCFWDSDTDNYAQDVFMNVRSQLRLFFNFFLAIITDNMGKISN